MGLGKEVLRTQTQIQDSERTRNVFVPLSLIPSEPTNTPSIGESGLVSRLGEISRLLFAEGRKEQKAEEHSEKGKEKEKPLGDGFEPFVNPGPGNNKENLLVNAYAGNFAQQMSLNRKGIERVLEIAHLDGQVFLTSFSPSRSRAIGEDDKRENPLSRIVSIPQGWKIEINDTRIRSELANKEKLTGKELQTAFIKKFNELVRNELLECIHKEKLSSKKDRYFRLKFLQSALIPVIPIALTLISWTLLPKPLSLAGLDIYIWVKDVINYAGGFCFYGIFNLLDHQINKGNKRTRDRLVKMNKLGLKSGAPYRKIDHIWEYFMPMVEIDKTIRSLAFLSMKGRRLVKENKEKTK